MSDGQLHPTDRVASATDREITLSDQQYKKSIFPIHPREDLEPGTQRAKRYQLIP
ncbi:hypothetical protein [Sporosarcina sp. A2]|uniref:hypothetical protein n=1 Tax=Sporosarcina sp. A2 TaxID=3393449 RepID=UPI003D79C77D